MTDDLKIARQDLAFLRGLAEDNHPMLRPLGAALAIAGVVHGLSALRFWAVGKGWIDWPAALRPLMGFDGLIAQIIVMVVVALIWPSGMRMPKGTSSPAGRAARGAINALGWGLGAAFVGLFVASMRLGGGQLMNPGFPVVLFALASAVWWVIFAVYRRAWAVVAAIASALIAAGLGLAAGTSDGILVVAAGLFGCVAGPGLALVRQSYEP